jgi:sulfoacetaldehyde acetyltransferase
VLEILVSRELGDPFRRDALSKPKRFLEKYRAYT